MIATPAFAADQSLTPFPPLATKVAPTPDADYFTPLPIPSWQVEFAARFWYGTHKRVLDIYRTFSGYVHANYAHVMEVYNGSALDFNLAGVPSVRQRTIRIEAVELAANSVLHAAAFIAATLKLTDLHLEIMQSLQ